jgi:hypothetical protein
MIGGTDHTAHRLMRLGLNARAATGVLVLGTAGSCVLGIGVGTGVVATLPAAITAAAVGITGLVWMLRMPVYVRPDAVRAATGTPRESRGPQTVVDLRDDVSAGFTPAWAADLVSIGERAQDTA